MDLNKEPFGTMPDGKSIEKFTLSNSRGITAAVISFGGILTAFTMPDSKGEAGNITPGYDTLSEYLSDRYYLGAIIGRFANRIAGGRFQLDGIQYTLARNEGGRNHLHGGNKGYDKVVWQAEGFQDQTSAGVTLTYRSPDGEEGYPGNLNIKVIYSLNEDNELKIEYWAETDKATPVNLTHHGYWNLAGAGSGSILEHELQLNCPNYLPVDAGLVPSGEIKSVKDTPMDFTSPKAIGRDMDHVPGGYDHCFIAAPSELSEPSSPGLRLVARVYEPKSGRGMEVWTTKPGLQFYAGNFLDGVHGAGGAVFDKHGAFCLETEFYPDAINQPNFPSCILRPGETYHHQTLQRYFTG